MPVIAIDLGGTKLITALVNNKGKILHEEKSYLGNRKGKQVGALIREEAEKIVKRAAAKKQAIEGIGICVPGIVNQKTGKVWAPNIRGWTDYPLKKELQEAYTSQQLPVEIESDRSCYILGEKWQGNAKGCSDAIFLAVGTGIGAGILVNNQVMRGKHGIAGAIGWMALDQYYRDEYGDCGCFEYNASGEGLRKVASEWLSMDMYQESSLRNIPIRELHAGHVFEAAKNGDELAEAVINHAIRYWGKAVANLVSLFNPEKIIVGGGVFGPGTPYLFDIFRTAKRWAQPVAMKKLVLEASALGDKAGLLGAAYLVIQKISNPEFSNV